LDLGGIGLKEIGRFHRQVKEAVNGLTSQKTSKADLYGELSIELDGISELTRIDPNKFLKVVMDSTPNYDTILKDYRERVFKLTKYTLSNEAVDSIVESMASLNMLKELVFEAGGYEKALEYACEKYGIAAVRISIGTAPEELSVVTLSDKHDIMEASRIVTSFYGPKVAQELYSLFVVSKVGRLLAVKDSFGKILGVIQLIFDRWGTTYIHAYCIPKQYRGTGVASMLLDAAEAQAIGGHIWATRSLDMTYNMQSLLEKGYSGRAYIPDYWGKGGPRIVFEKDIGRPYAPDRSGFGSLPRLDTLDGSVDAFVSPLRGGAPLDEALNAHGLRIVGLMPSAGDASGGSDAVVLKKTGEECLFRSRDYGASLAPMGEGRFTPAILRSYEEIHEALRLQEESQSDPREIYGTLRMFTYTGLIVGLRDVGGGLAAFTTLIWDAERDVLFHALTASNDHGSWLKPLLIGYACASAKENGAGKARVIHSIEDVDLVRVMVNDMGFAATQEYLNPYGNGQNYLMLEKDLTATQPAANLDPSGTPTIKSILDIREGLDSVLVPYRSYGLTASVLKEGYAVKSVIDSGREGLMLRLSR